MTRLDVRQYETAITWIPTVVAEHLGKDYRDEGRDRVWGSLHICRATGAFYEFLKKRAGEEWSVESGSQWWVKYLDTHPGLGTLEPEDEEYRGAPGGHGGALSALFRYRGALASGRYRGRVPDLPQAPGTLS